MSEETEVDIVSHLKVIAAQDEEQTNTVLEALAQLAEVVGKPRALIRDESGKAVASQLVE